MYHCFKCGRSVQSPNDASATSAICKCGHIVSFPEIASKLPELISAKRYHELNRVLKELEDLNAPIKGLDGLKEDSEAVISQAKQIFMKAVELESAVEFLEARKMLEKLLSICSDYPEAEEMMQRLDIEIETYAQQFANARRAVCEKEYEKALMLIDGLGTRFKSKEIDALSAEASNGLRRRSRKKYFHVGAASLSLVLLLVSFVGIIRYLNHNTFNSYCGMANVAFSVKDFDRCIFFYKEALKVSGYSNDATAMKLLGEAEKELEKRTRFDELMSEGRRAMNDDDWLSAEKAFKSALQISGYENEDEAMEGLKKCEMYFLDREMKNKDIFNSAFDEGNAALLEKDYEKAFKTFEKALKIPGYEKNADAAAKKEQCRANMSNKKLYDRLISEGKDSLCRKNWADAAAAFKNALALPGYGNDVEAGSCLKSAQEGASLQRKENESDWKEIKSKMGELLIHLKDNTKNISERIESADSTLAVLQRILDSREISEPSRDDIANCKFDIEQLRYKLIRVPSGFVMLKDPAAGSNGWALEILHIRSCIEMVYVAPGEFMMGADETKGHRKGDDAGDAMHKVILSRGYYIGKHEVTQFQWNTSMGEPTGAIKQVGLPVERASWKECKDFCEKLGRGFRLPSEAEWEFAARGGTRSCGFNYSGSNMIDEVAWYRKNSENSDLDNSEIYKDKCVIRPVGLKKANELGIHDMSGNAYEWCEDWEGPYPADLQTDPSGPGSGEYKVLRGGNYRSDPSDCLSTSRHSMRPGSKFCGFRVVLPVD